MKDLFMPVVLTVLVILAGGFFIMKIYSPQKDTVNALTDNARQAETTIIAELDENGAEVSGAVVKALYEQYKGEVTVNVDSKNAKEEFDKVKNTDIYIKTIKRNKDKKITQISFEKRS